MLPRAEIEAMDQSEWDAHEIEAARVRLERYQMAGMKKQNGQSFMLADLLPPRLAAEFMPKPMAEDEVMRRFELAGFPIVFTKP